MSSVNESFQHLNARIAELEKQLENLRANFEGHGMNKIIEDLQVKNRQLEKQLAWYVDENERLEGVIQEHQDKLADAQAQLKPIKRDIFWHEIQNLIEETHDWSSADVADSVSRVADQLVAGAFEAAAEFIRQRVWDQNSEVCIDPALGQLADEIANLTPESALVALEQVKNEAFDAGEDVGVSDRAAYEAKHVSEDIDTCSCLLHVNLRKAMEQRIAEAIIGALDAIQSYAITSGYERAFVWYRKQANRAKAAGPICTCTRIAKDVPMTHEVGCPVRVVGAKCES